MPPERILVVEDDPELQRDLRSLLEGEGYAVDSALNGREALTVLSSGRPPDAILLDLMMPVMNGYEFLAEVRSGTASAKAIPTVLLSAAPDSVKTSVQLGLRLVQKPFDIDVLLDTLRDAIATPARI
jgi:CheY-like chemotaxis protein